MKKLTMSLIAAMIIVMTSCEKQEITPDKPVIKENLKECRVWWSVRTCGRYRPCGISQPGDQLGQQRARHQWLRRRFADRPGV
ncbi:hypothetical protein [Daejeonella sp.]|uniref:hypothetical protein n=1 Tax=Daejeonella sp. TaxID=2805397 RepID=UPI003983314F